MTLEQGNQVSARDSAFADYDRAREFATECWRRAMRRRLQNSKTTKG